MKLVVGIDVDIDSAQLLQQARQLLQVEHSEVWLIHVVAPEPDFVGYDVGPQTVRDALAAEYQAEHTHLQSLAQSLRDEGLAATALMVQGPTAETLLAQAEKLGADMLIVGSHGHGAMYNLVVGSVTEDLIRRSNLPVHVVPVRK